MSNFHRSSNILKKMTRGSMGGESRVATPWAYGGRPSVSFSETSVCSIVNVDIIIGDGTVTEVSTISPNALGLTIDNSDSVTGFPPGYYTVTINTDLGADIEVIGDATYTINTGEYIVYYVAVASPSDEVRVNVYSESGGPTAATVMFCQSNPPPT